MNRKQKQELTRLEKQILKTAHYIEGRGMIPPFREWDSEHKKEFKALLRQRSDLLNEMFECTPKEVEAFAKVNTLLNDLTKKMHAKALSLYRALLTEGYDPDFDDDIVIDGTLRFVFSDEASYYCREEADPNPYGSRFAPMLDILYDIHEDTPECAFCKVSYELRHKPDMPAEEFGLDDFLDDGASWNEVPLNRAEFKEINICHAVHDLICHKNYSIPDMLSMNDFWVEVNILHQHIVDRDGNRFSCIEPDEEE